MPSSNTKMKKTTLLREVLCNNMVYRAKKVNVLRSHVSYTLQECFIYLDYSIHGVPSFAFEENGNGELRAFAYKAVRFARMDQGYLQIVLYGNREIDIEFDDLNLTKSAYTKILMNHMKFMEVPRYEESPTDITQGSSDSADRDDGNPEDTHAGRVDTGSVLAVSSAEDSHHSEPDQ